MLQLEWGYSWVCLLSAILHYDCIFLSLPEMWQKLKTDFVPCCAQILSRFLYSIYWSTATVGRWSSQWIVIASWWKWWSDTLWPHHLTRLWLHSLLLYLQIMLWWFLYNSVDMHTAYWIIVDSDQTDCKHELLGSKMDLHHRSRNTVKISSSSTTSGPTLSTG
jgi:hypothetical protein